MENNLFVLLSIQLPCASGCYKCYTPTKTSAELLHIHQHDLSFGSNTPGRAKLKFSARWILTVGNKMIFKILKPFGELRRGESAYTDTAKQPVRSLHCDLNLIKRCFHRDKKASEVNAAFKGHRARSWQQCQIKALSQKFSLSSPSSCQEPLVHTAQPGGL